MYNKIIIVYCLSKPFMKIATSLFSVKDGKCEFEYASEYCGSTKACNEIS